MAKAYVIIEEWGYHGETDSSIVNNEVYLDRDECLKQFKFLVKHVKETDIDYSNCEPENIIDEEDKFQFWEDGNYTENNYSVRIEELTVKEVK